MAIRRRRLTPLLTSAVALIPLLLLVPRPAPAGATPPPDAATPAAARPALVLVEAAVTRVIDGSSLDAQIAGARVAVAYLDAEAPPANTPCGQAALARNRELVGQRVLLEEDPAYAFDARGLRLFYAYTTDGLLIDAILVQEGLARAARSDGRHGALLAELEAEARAAGRGCLWRHVTATPTATTTATCRSPSGTTARPGTPTSTTTPR